MRRGNGQIVMQFPRFLQVVANHWNPGYHLVWDGHHAAGVVWGETAFYDEQPSCFRSIEEAVSFARERGVEPEIPEETRKRWGKAS